MKAGAGAALPLAPLRRADTLPEKIYQSLHEKIASGEIDPAQRLTEMQLAALLGVSRTPVREALARLRREGLLDPLPRKDAALARHDIEEVMEVRRLIEPYAAARAAERATPDGVALLQAALEQEERAFPLKSPQKFAMANHAFRQQLLALAANGRLAESASRYDAQIQALRRATLEQPAHRRIVLEHHRVLVAAVRAGDPQRAGQAMADLMREATATMLALGDNPRRKRKP